MPLQRVMAGIAAALLFTLGVAAALADAPATTTSDTTAATTTATTTLATTTASATTTSPLTQTTTSAATITTSTGATATPAHELTLAQSCPLGGVILLTPNRSPTVVGAIADARTRNAHVDALVYPADGSIATASSVTLRARACANGQPKSADAQLRDVSLFGGTVTASRITLELGNTEHVTVTGLAVEGSQVSSVPASPIPLQTWGYLVAGSQASVSAPSGGQAIAALSIHLLQTHAGLPAGTTILVAVAGQGARPRAAPAKAGKHTRVGAQHRKKHGRATHEPLKVTPPLGQRHYIFPVAGQSEYIDTYGAFRSDVPGNWHHGDDIFASLGTPVVAVASGTINRVGWERLGGWRLWVRDSVGDEFYYAHLAGYAPTSLQSNRVKAGEVIGFIGNTGDAFTTSPPVVSGDAVDVVARLKEESEVPLRSHGSLSMNRALMAAGLVDRVQVTIFPVITGQNGSDAIFEGAADFDLELIESRTLDGNIQELTYRPTLHV
jgi:murein DD-endopeptidase MepM/ murein hydrolase activator NlpD